jgi:hypothetical protein
VICRCKIENVGLGLCVLDPASETRPLGGVRIEDNVFSGRGVHLLLWGTLSNVAVIGNRFLEGKNGINLNFSLSAQAEQIVIANNTFFQSTYWIGLVQSIPSQKGITICNNLILGAEKVEWGWPSQLEEVSRVWSFRNNWWEPGDVTLMDEFPGPPVAELHRDVALLSRDPASPDFLRPRPGDSLAAAGAGPPFPSSIGALAPPENQSKPK